MIVEDKIEELIDEAIVTEAGRAMTAGEVMEAIRSNGVGDSAGVFAQSSKTPGKLEEVIALQVNEEGNVILITD